MATADPQELAGHVGWFREFGSLHFPSSTWGGCLIPSTIFVRGYVS